jgi:hypothetical protein
MNVSLILLTFILDFILFICRNELELINIIINKSIRKEIFLFK